MSSKRSLSHAIAFVLVALVSVAVAIPRTAYAQATLITGLGGAAGFGTNVLTPNDDGSSASISLAPYDLNGLCFFGQSHNALFINNNGNVTFNAAIGTFTPDPFPVAAQPMIAPYWADVDTRGTGTNIPPENRVYYDIRNVGGLGQLVVTWYRVGYFNSHIDLRDTFQLVIREITPSSGTTPADYDVEFRYNALTWTTGDASMGANGLGGVPAQAGFDAGDNVHYSQLPGSRTASVLNLQNTSNATPAEPGVWRFRFHSCQLACNTNADCAGTTPICDTTNHVCRACTMNSDCGGSTPYCATSGANVGRCVQCNVAANCSTNMCSNNACVCTTNANCSGSTPICDLGSHVCRSCDPGVVTDCVGTTPVCGPAGRCVQCGPGLTALCIAPNIACSAAGSCVECTAGMTAACTGTRPVCNTTTNTCRACATATQATDCPTAGAPLCQTAGTGSGMCVAATSTLVTPANGSTTLNMSPPITGTAPPGSTVIIFVDGMEIGRTTANASGMYSFTPPMPLSVGSHTARVAVAVGAGQGPNSNSSTFVVAQCVLNTDCSGSTPFCDTAAHLCRGCLTNANCSGSAPVCDSGTHACRACNVTTQSTDCPLATAPVCVSAGPMAGGCVAATATVITPATGATLATRRPTVTGTAPPGSTVVIYVDGVEVGRTTADASGNFSFALPSDLSVGPHTASAAVAVGATTGAMSTPNAFVIVQCLASSDCAMPTPVCDTVAHVCHGCLTNGDCTVASAPVCDTSTQTCRGCGSDSECGGSTPACSSGGACVACTATNQTACGGSTPACDVDNNVCVLCTPGAGGNASACASSDDGHACEQPIMSSPAFCGCGSDTDCGNATSGRICEATTSRCVAGCFPGGARNNCPTGQFCTSSDPTVPGVCTTTCNFDADCASLTESPFCLAGSDGAASRCVQCIEDTQCAGRTDRRTLCIGANNTCAQCTASNSGMCMATGTGSACLATGLCGCTTDSDCASDRMCNAATNACEPRPTMTDGGTDASVDASADSGSDAGGDAARDGGADASADGSLDGAPDAGINVTGGGACSCRVPGAPSHGSSRSTTTLGLLAAVVAIVASRRRRAA